MPFASSTTLCPGEPSAQTTRRIRICIADDHVLLRQTLADLLNSERDMEVVGEASDGVAAVELVLRLRPDVVILDVDMPQLDGIEATRQIVEQTRQVGIIGFSTHDEPRIAARMRQAGAAGYLTKGSDPDDLLDAIRTCRA